MNPATNNRERRLALVLSIMGLFVLINPAYGQEYIADYRVAKEAVLRDIPAEFIHKARTELVVAYQHTSHGTHVSRGAFGLQDYKEGDQQLFGISETTDPDRLEFRDYALEDYAPDGVTAIDHSVDETAFIQTTRNYLDAPENASVNVVMWSWCNIAGHDPEGNYLPGMDSLISEYGAGGSKIGAGEGQREIPVSFIYMTGHANKNANTGPLNPKEQAALINAYCTSHQRFCLDYYSIDTHDMEDSYYEDAGDDGDSDSYGGNFYLDWQNAHALGEDYFENKRTPGGDVATGAHNSQHITANRKAYAFWWILARMAGWEGSTSSRANHAREESFLIFPNPGSGHFRMEAPSGEVTEISVINAVGQVISTHIPGEPYAREIFLDLNGIESGLYMVRLKTKDQQVYTSALIIE